MELREALGETIHPRCYRRAETLLASGGIWPTGFFAIGRESGGRAGRDGAPGRNDEPGSTRGWHQ